MCLISPFSKKPANNILLKGARGTGKSSPIKAILHEFASHGLRLIEGGGESGYKTMKSAFNGSVSDQVDKILMYATSNRRHLLPEYMKDNESYVHSDDRETHPGEVVEEKITLSECFGL